jgi:5-methylcytosine-specific restriction endonuclease McrA
MANPDPLHPFLVALGWPPKEQGNPVKVLKFLCKKFGVEPPPFGGKKGARLILRDLRRTIADRATVRRDNFSIVMMKRLVDKFSVEHDLQWDMENIAFARSKDFYKSQRWKNLRIQALDKYRACLACGKGPKDGVVLHVDHVFSRTIYPEYALNINNLQVLCEDCNLGKGNVATYDFR